MDINISAQLQYSCTLTSHLMSVTCTAESVNDCLTPGGVHEIEVSGNNVVKGV